MKGEIGNGPTAAALLGLSLLLGACTTAHEVPLTGDATPPSLAAGDEVTIVTKDGRKLTFTVEQVAAGAIIGDGTQVQIAEIARMEVARVDPAKTAVAVTATPLVMIFSTLVVLSVFLAIAL